LAGGFRNLNRPIEGLQYSYNYTDWRHNEVSGGEIENRFYNKQSDYRLVVEQRRSGRLSGSFGGWGLRRDFKVVGAEAITPPVVQNALAAFAVETLTLSDRIRMQFGARLREQPLPARAARQPLLHQACPVQPASTLRSGTAASLSPTTTTPTGLRPLRSCTPKVRTWAT
jgi:iron complex outermembrane receptor protein